MVLDSGLGGLTVVRALRAAAPAEDIVYFGDTARLPYGTKTGATVYGFVRQILTYLRRWNPKHIVIACNTASALALPTLRSSFPGLSISGVIDPGAKAASIAGGPKPVPLIGVIATEATIRAKAYERAIHRRRNHARILLRPTPLLVPLIEEGRGPDDPVVKLAVRQYLAPMARHRLDVMVLGCTHYPIYKDLIQQIVGKHVPVIDSAIQCAEDVTRRLRGRKVLRELLSGGRVREGFLRCYVTDDPVRFGRLAPRFLGFEIDQPTWVAPEELYGADPTLPLAIPA